MPQKKTTKAHDTGDNSMVLADQFKTYLKLVNLDPDKMSTNQLIETQRAFYAGIAVNLHLMTNVLADQPEHMAVMGLDYLIRQSLAFWRGQSNG